jgi:beta-N-acetylhexosaminidase
VRRFFDPSEQVFNGPLVARDAFQAGSDLLLLEDFVSSTDSDSAETIRKTLEAFATRYRDDVVFAEQVDAAVLRILRLKLRIYGGAFDADSTEGAVGAQGIRSSSELAFLVARAGASLVSPIELSENLLGEMPSTDQRLVFFTDILNLRQCSTCAAEPVIAVDALEQMVGGLYGPRSGGQARSWNLSSFSMADLARALGERPPPNESLAMADPDEVGAALDSADWVVFALLSASDGRFGSDALKLMLDRHPDRLQDKRVVAFAFDVPYEFDATDLSKIDLRPARASPRSLDCRPTYFRSRPQATTGNRSGGAIDRSTRALTQSEDRLSTPSPQAAPNPRRPVSWAIP